MAPTCPDVPVRHVRSRALNSGYATMARDVWTHGRVRHPKLRVVILRSDAYFFAGHPFSSQK